MDEPLVSIIIPTYNRSHVLCATLNSVIAQTYSNWECIIVDDASTDNTVEILRKYQIEDSRFKYVIKSEDVKKGASISRNLGLKIAKGRFIQFLDSDDLLAEKKLEEQLKLLLKEDERVIITCKWEKFDKVDQELLINENRVEYKAFHKTKDYFDLIGLNGGFFPSHCFLISKELINYSGYWNESLTVNDDGEFFFRMLLNADKILFSDKTYVLYRNNTVDNLSILNSDEKAFSLLNSWKIIEALYVTKYKETNSLYITKKKNSVYNEFKRKFPRLIAENKAFFKQQIKNDTLFLRMLKLKKRIINRLKIIFRF